MLILLSGLRKIRVSTESTEKHTQADLQDQGSSNLKELGGTNIFYLLYDLK